MTRSTASLMSALVAASLLAACASTPPPPAEPLPPVPMSFDQTLSGDALFAFGKSSIDEISAEGRVELDALAARVMAAAALDVVHVIGHSDRIGAARANMALSNRRAGAVRDYLVQAGVPADRITAVGRGSVEPVAECDGRGQALIDCLAPNRRVEVKVLLP